MSFGDEGLKVLEHAGGTEVNRDGVVDRGDLEIGISLRGGPVMGKMGPEVIRPMVKEKCTKIRYGGRKILK